MGPTREVRSKTKDLLCDICVDVVTDLDNWITSDSTMDEIIDFVENLCSLFGAIDPALETLCDTLIESQLQRSSIDLSMTTSTHKRSARTLELAPSLLLLLLLLLLESIKYVFCDQNLIFPKELQ